MKKQNFSRLSYATFLGEHYYYDQSEQDSIDQLLYLTNPSRGEHVSLNTLRNRIRNMKAGTLLRTLDPVAFNVAYAEANRKKYHRPCNV